VNETFFEFITRMPEWVKSGSALGAKAEFLIGGEKWKARLHKRAAMNYMEPKELER